MTSPSPGVAYLSRIQHNDALSTSSVPQQSDLVAALRALNVTHSSSTRPRIVTASDNYHKLSFSGKALVYSIGASIHRVFTSHDDIVDAAFVSFPDLRHTSEPPTQSLNQKQTQSHVPLQQEHSSHTLNAERKRLFGPFIDLNPPRWQDVEGARADPCPDSSLTSQLRGICIAHRHTLDFYFEDGTETAVSTPWSVSRIWPIDNYNRKGLIVERRDLKGPSKCGLYSLSSPSSLFCPITVDSLGEFHGQIISIEPEGFVVTRGDHFDNQGVITTFSLLPVQSSSSTSAQCSTTPPTSRRSLSRKPDHNRADESLTLINNSIGSPNHSLSTTRNRSDGAMDISRLPPASPFHHPNFPTNHQHNNNNHFSNNISDHLSFSQQTPTHSQFPPVNQPSQNSFQHPFRVTPARSMRAENNLRQPGTADHHSLPRTSEHAFMAREAEESMVWDNDGSKTGALNRSLAFMSTDSTLGPSEYVLEISSIDTVENTGNTSVDENINVFVFDRRQKPNEPSSCMLAIHFLDRKDLLIDNFTRDRTDGSEKWNLNFEGRIKTRATSVNLAKASRAKDGIHDLCVESFPPDHESPSPSNFLVQSNQSWVDLHGNFSLAANQTPPIPDLVLDVLRVLGVSGKNDKAHSALFAHLYGQRQPIDFQTLEDAFFMLNEKEATDHSDEPDHLFQRLQELSANDRIFRSMSSTCFSNPKEPSISDQNSTAHSFCRTYLDSSSLLAIHLLYEELRLTCDRLADAHKVGRLLAHIVINLADSREEAESWLQRYRRDLVVFDDRCLNRLPSIGDEELSPNASIVLVSPPPDLHVYLRNLIARNEDFSHDTYPNVEPTTHSFYGATDCFPLTRTVLQLAKHHCAKQGDSNSVATFITHLVNTGWNSERIERLGFGIQIAFKELIRSCKLSLPPSAAETWGPKEFDFIGREDLATLLDDKRGMQLKRKSEERTKSIAERSPTQPQSPSQESMQYVTRFGADLRVREVEKMFQSTSRVTLKVAEKRGVSEHNLALEHQGLVNATANRTFALPMGQSSFYYRSQVNNPHTPVQIPDFCFEVKLLPDESIWSPESSFLSPEKFTWPEFHAGVAAGLKMMPSPNRFDSSEIALNRPAELNSRHAGFLLGLGLNKCLRSLAIFQAFKYLDSKHEETSIGLLLGLACSYAGTGDTKVMSVLSVHLSALHPPSSIPLHLPTLTQSAGLLGLGILNIGKGKRSLADALIKELLNTKVLETRHNDDCREAYALAVGFAFGMIMLGRGPELSRSPKSNILSQLKTLIQGDNKNPLPGDDRPSAGIDVQVTSPAATTAIALAYFQQGKQSSEILELLELPSTGHDLDHIRPDLIMLRTFARCLINWDDVKSDDSWIESNLPRFISQRMKTIFSTSGSGGFAESSYFDSDIEVAYWNIVSGASLAVGIKFAGTAREDAHAALIGYVDRLIKSYSHKGSGLQHKLKMASLRNCINVLLMALSCLMAGTGELHVLRRLRMFHGQVGDPLDYGSHMVTHMSIGLLFLGQGRYTLSSSPASVAFLVCAFFPIFPINSTDNRAHLQAARHLWALAVEPRCLMARDVTTGEIAYLPIKLRVREPSSNEAYSQHIVCPSLLPDYKTVERVRIDTPRYWPITLDLRRNEIHRNSLLRSRTLIVKRRAGYLSYLDDARGNQNLFTRLKAEANAVVQSCSKTASMMLSSSTVIPGLQHFLSALSPSAELAGAVRFLVGWDKHDSLNDNAGKRSNVTFSSKENGNDSGSGDDVYHADGVFRAFCASVLMECLVHDKSDIIPLYYSVYLAQLGLENYSHERGNPIDFYTGHAISNFDFLMELYQNTDHSTFIFTGRKDKGHNPSGKSGERAGGVVGQGLGISFGNSTLLNGPFISSVKKTLDEVTRSVIKDFGTYFWTERSKLCELSHDDPRLSLLLIHARAPTVNQLFQVKKLLIKECNHLRQKEGGGGSDKSYFIGIITTILRKVFATLDVNPALIDGLAVSVGEAIPYEK